MGGSSTGKTTVLVAAASAWGKGASSGGYVQNWRATANGLEGLAALHSDAPLCLDEIGQAPGRTITEAAYMLANGMGKTRAATDGSARTTRSWRCMILSTGEKGLAEKIVEEGGRVQAGQPVRLIDIPADAGAGMGLFENLHGHESPRVFADALKQAAFTHYGHAARAFITALLGNMQNVRGQLPVALSEADKLLSPLEQNNIHQPKHKGDTMNTITIYTAGDTAEDLRSRCERIREGATPGTKELLAILGNYICLLQEQNPKTAKR